MLPWKVYFAELMSFGSVFYPEPFGISELQLKKASVGEIISSFWSLFPSIGLAPPMCPTQGWDVKIADIIFSLREDTKKQTQLAYEKERKTCSWKAQQGSCTNNTN